MANLCGIVDELSQQNIFVNIKVLEFTRIVYDEKDAHIWKSLQRPVSEGVYKIKRVLSTDDRPLLLDYNYFPDEIGVKYKNFDINQNVILTGLDTLGYHVDFAKQNISAKAATNSQAKVCRSRPGLLFWRWTGSPTPNRMYRCCIRGRYLRGTVATALF